MRKLIAIFGFLSYENLYADYTGRLPSNITLQNNESQTHKLTSTCGNQYCYAGLPSAFNPNAYDFSYTTSSGTSSLTIQSVTPANNINQTQSILYMGKLSVGANSALTLKDFHTISIQNGITLQSGATLDMTMQKGGKINASEFGPSSKIILSRNADIYLSSGATLNASNMEFFILDSIAYIQNGATMNIESNTIRIQNALKNYGTLKLQGSVWNVGQSGNGIDLATSNFINTEGNVTIQGDFYNGGKPTADSNQNSWWQNDAPSPGGGNLITYGGYIHVTGKLTNQQGKENINTQNSSVQIYGSTLKVDKGMENDSFSTLLFGAYKGQMGKLEGDLTNNGRVVVDTTGIGMGVHELITGTIQGNANFDIIFKNGSNEFINANMQNGTLHIEADSTKINAFKSTLSHNEKSIINALDTQLNGIYTYGGSTILRNVSYNTEQGLKRNFINMPLAILDSMQSSFMRFSDTQTLNLAAFGGGIISDGISGGIGGIQAFYNIDINSHLLAAHFVYGYGTTQQSSDVYTGALQSHALGFTLIDRILLGVVSMDIGLRGAFGFFTMQDMLNFSGVSMKLGGNFNAYNLQADITINYPIEMQNFTLTPSIGLRQSAIIESAYKNASSMQLQNNGYTNHITSLALRLNAEYELEPVSIFANMIYDQNLYNSINSITIALNNQNITLDSMPLTYSINVDSGVNWQINSNMQTSLQAFYKMSKSLSRIIGLQANFSYQF